MGGVKDWSFGDLKWEGLDAVPVSESWFVAVLMAFPVVVVKEEEEEEEEEVVVVVV